LGFGEFLSLFSDMVLSAKFRDHEDTRDKVIQASNRWTITLYESGYDGIESGIIFEIFIYPISGRSDATKSHGDEGSHHIFWSKSRSTEVFVYWQSKQSNGSQV